ncbi:MAG: molybdopterin oxidoreductase [Deltaproteobacteria bacterium]|nr:MAG: molybdopterin oxidoreductase [Deltaproteobacteria bacterium]
MKTAKIIALAILAALAVFGVWAAGVRLTEGMRVTNLTSNMTWGMWVAFYIYCIGLSAGSFLMSTLVYVFGMHQFEKMGRMALLSALFALFGGLTFVWIDLGHPWRFYKIFTGWQASSVLAWESLFYIFYIVAICTELWFLMRCDLATLRDGASGWKRAVYGVLALGWKCPTTEQQLAACHASSLRWVKRIGVVGIPIALGVHGGTGALFAVVAAKPYWFSGLFPIIFLVSALVSGCGLMLFLYAWFGRRDDDYERMVFGLRNFLVLFIAVDLILFISDLLVGTYASIPDHTEVWHEVLFGDYWYVFWIGQIGMAWLGPLAIASVRATRTSPAWLGIAGGLVVAGIVAVRLNLVIPAYLHPQLPGLDEALAQPRTAYEYFPSAIEWLSSFGLLALLALAFIGAWTLLPMYDVLSAKLAGRERAQGGAA